VTGATAEVTVTYQGQTSAPFPVTITAAVPGLFTSNASGTGELAALNQDYSINSITNPAGYGSIVQLFATGEGQTYPAGVDGKLATAPYPYPLQDVSVTIGGQPAHVAYAGAAPGEVAGVMQVNATIPAGIFGPTVPISLSVGNAQSPAGTTIAVASPEALETTFSVTSKQTAASIVENSNGSLTCAAPTAQTSFTAASAYAYVYFTFTGAQTGDVLSFDWVHPSGQVDSSHPTVTLSFDGTGCADESLTIAGGEGASELGDWQVRVYHNKVIQFVQTFSIIQAPSGFAVVTGSPVMAASVPENANGQLTCGAPAAQTTFKTTDADAWVWFAFTGAQTGDVFSVTWTQPDGQSDSYQPSTTLNFSGAGCYVSPLAITGQAPASEPGKWQANVYRNGGLLFSQPFTISQ